MLDHKTFSQVLRSFERKNKGWIDQNVGIQVIVSVDGVLLKNVMRVNRKRGVAEYAIVDAKGRLVVSADGEIATKYAHGKIKLIQIAGK